MEDKSKHSRVKKRFDLATSVIGFVVVILKLIPVLIDLFNMAFNWSAPFKRKCDGKQCKLVKPI